MAIRVNMEVEGKEYAPFVVTVERGKKDLGVDISRIPHGEQEFEHYKPIRPGETYLCQSRIIDIYEKTGRSGPMAFVVREMAVVDRESEIVCLVRHITVVRLCRGKVLEKRPAGTGADHEVELELWVENQKGEKVVTGRATVTLPSRG